MEKGADIEAANNIMGATQQHRWVVKAATFSERAALHGAVHGNPEVLLESRDGRPRLFG